MGGGGLTGAQGGIIELSSKGGGAAARRPSIGGGGLAGTQEGSFTGAGAAGGDGSGVAAFSSLDFFLNQPKNIVDSECTCIPGENAFPVALDNLYISKFQKVQVFYFLGVYNSQRW